MKKLLVGLIIYIVIWLATLIQVNTLSTITLFGTKANIGIVIVVGIGLMCDKGAGSIIGIVYGFMQDIIFGKAIGVYALIYMILGYVSGELGRGFSRENKTTLVAMVGVSTIAFNIIFQIMAILIYKYDLSLFNLLINMVKESIFNMLLAVILFRPLQILAEIINKSKKSYYLL